MCDTGTGKGRCGREEQRGVEFDLLTSWFEITSPGRFRDSFGLVLAVVVVVPESFH